MPQHTTKAASKRKSDNNVSNFIEDLRSNDSTEGVYVARVLKVLGNKRIQVVYCVGEKAVVAELIIPGKFSKRGKHEVRVEINTYLLIAETGISQNSVEMLGIIDRHHLEQISKYIEIDKRVRAIETDTTAIMSGKVTEEDGFEFEAVKPVEEQELNVDDI